MLQLSLPRPALLRALKVLKLCTGVCGPQHLPSWNLVGVTESRWGGRRLCEALGHVVVNCVN
jgi:hypothetical protein